MFGGIVVYLGFFKCYRTVSFHEFCCSTMFFSWDEVVNLRCMHK